MCLTGDGDRVSHRLCVTFSCLSSFYSCIFINLSVIPGKTAGHNFVGPVQAEFLVIPRGAGAAPRSSLGFAASSHLRERKKWELNLNLFEGCGNFCNGFNLGNILCVFSREVKRRGILVLLITEPQGFESRADAMACCESDTCPVLQLWAHLLPHVWGSHFPRKAPWELCTSYL